MICTLLFACCLIYENAVNYEPGYSGRYLRKLQYYTLVEGYVEPTRISR